MNKKQKINLSVIVAIGVAIIISTILLKGSMFNNILAPLAVIASTIIVGLPITYLYKEFGLID